MVSFKRRDLDVTSLRSLAWHRNGVIDLLNGGIRYYPDGTIEEPRVHRGFAYKFDSVVSYGEHAVLHERYGTKGLLVDMEKLNEIRELNRSYYHAEDYAYPIAMFCLPDGRAAIVHCPNEYCALDIEIIDSGEIVTKRASKMSSDIFHSKLAISADGRYLVENGWVWHPWNVVQAYDIQLALDDPNHLDGEGKAIPQGGSLGWEPESVTICGHHVVTASILDSSENPLDSEEEFEIKPAEDGIPESEVPGDASKVRRVASSELSIVDGQGNPIDLGVKAKYPPGLYYLLQTYDLDSGNITSSRVMPDLVGRMMPIGQHHVISFYDHPKLIEVATGKVVMRWEDLYAGPEQGQPSAMMSPPQLPTLACDPTNKRFAIGTDKRVTFITVEDLAD